TRPQAGSSGLAHDFARFREQLTRLRNQQTSSLHRSEPRAGLGDGPLDRAGQLIELLRKALLPLESLGSAKPYDFAELAKRHRDALMALSCDPHGGAIA